MFNIIKIGIHPVNFQGFKASFKNYLIPKPLLIESSVKREGFQQYRWLFFFICIRK